MEAQHSAMTYPHDTARMLLTPAFFSIMHGSHRYLLPDFTWTGGQQHRVTDMG
jgi:hypothetical protein